MVWNINLKTMKKALKIHVKVALFNVPLMVFTLFTIKNETPSITRAHQLLKTVAWHWWVGIIKPRPDVIPTDQENMTKLLLKTVCFDLMQPPIGSGFVEVNFSPGGLPRSRWKMLEIRWNSGSSILHQLDPCITHMWPHDGWTSTKAKFIKTQVLELFWAQLCDFGCTKFLFTQGWWHGGKLGLKD